MFYFLKYLTPVLFLFACSTPPNDSPPPQETPQPTAVAEQSGAIKINWLKNIKTTNRISSNHYSDFVIDKKGNSYVASFYMENKLDYIYIVKISKDRKIIWETTQPNKGRATAIAMDKEENIWVTGFFSGTLDFSTKTATSISPHSLFLAQFDTDGKCKQIISSMEGAAGFNVHVNAQGNILLNGTCRRQLTIKNKTIEKEEGQTDQFFIALIDKNGDCQLLNYFPLNIHRIKSDTDGNFYLSGNFYGEFNYEKFKGQTDGFYDNDAFLMKINTQGKTEWIKQYGELGTRRNGYRSDEVFSDFIIEKNGDITVIGLSEKDDPLSNTASTERYKPLKSVVLTIDKTGNVKNEKTIATHPNDGSIQTIAKNLKDEYFLTFTAKPNFIVEGERIPFEGEFRSILLKYNDRWELMEMKQPSEMTDALFRVSKNTSNNIYFTGHYKKNLSFENQSIKNEGAHTLFMMQIE